MSRSKASCVSALSGCVANGPQTVHLVSSAPSKIPYGGFSLSTASNQLEAAATFAGARAPAYRLHRSCLQPQRLTRRRTFVQAALRLSVRATGPVALGSPTGCIVRPAHRLLWPHLRLCWPPKRFMNYSVRLRSCLRQLQRVPNLLCESFDAMPLPILRWPQRLPLTMSSSPVLPSPLRYWLGDHIYPPIRNRWIV